MGQRVGFRLGLAAAALAGNSSYPPDPPTLTYMHINLLYQAGLDLDLTYITRRIIAMFGSRRSTFAPHDGCTLIAAPAPSAGNTPASATH